MSLLVVVGATGGIGSACIARLAGTYSTILAVSRRPLPAHLASEPTVQWQSADLSEQGQRDALVARIQDFGAPLSGLVFASGVAHRAPVEKATPDDWDHVLAANVSGPGNLVSALVADVEWNEPASIVFIGSLSARRALPDRSLYGASKAAIEHYARCIAVELAPRHIHVNTLSVGVTDTPFLEGDRARLDAYVADRIPAGRMVDPTEVAQAVQDLLRNRGSMIGATLELDGGTGVLG